MFDLGTELDRDYGTHRAGWSYAVNCLKELHHDDAPSLISFVEKKFIFGAEPGDFNNQFENINKPWVGFIHVPENVPTWFFGHFSPENLLATEHFSEAMDHCKGLFTLSSPLESWLKQRVDVPISTVLHPTAHIDLLFSMERFHKEPKLQVVQLGFWLRKLHAIHQLNLPEDKFKKIVVGASAPYQVKLTSVEKNLFDYNFEQQDVEYTGFLSNSDYDDLLAKSVVFVDFYDTAANNAIIECIVRAVPIVCPPLKAVTDYLGVDYPLYFQNYAHAETILNDMDLLRKGHEYLKKSGVIEKLTNKYFLDSIKSSDVVKGL